MNDLSFQEKSTWGTLVVQLVIAALYFSSVLNLAAADALHAGAVVRLAVGYTVLLVIMLVAYHILIAVISRPEVDDERDRLIGWRAGSIAGVVLGFGVFGVIGHVLIGGMLDDPRLQSPAAIANLLLLAVLVATVVELGLKLYFYRRGV